VGLHYEIFDVQQKHVIFSLRRVRVNYLKTGEKCRGSEGEKGSKIDPAGSCASLALTVRKGEIERRMGMEIDTLYYSVPGRMLDVRRGG
jgi:hypothetical protein